MKFIWWNSEKKNGFRQIAFSNKNFVSERNATLFVINNF